MRSKAERLEVELVVACCPISLEKRYRAQPVRRVTLPNRNGGEPAFAGHPDRSDRVVQPSTCVPCWNRYFDGDFHPSSYGYRPGRSAHQAISKAANCSFAATSVHWVVDMDLSKCFDTLDHD